MHWFAHILVAMPEANASLVLMGQDVRHLQNDEAPEPLHNGMMLTEE